MQAKSGAGTPLRGKTTLLNASCVTTSGVSSINNVKSFTVIPFALSPFSTTFIQRIGQNGTIFKDNSRRQPAALCR